MTKADVKKPKRGQYEVDGLAKPAHLDRVTTILDWSIKGDGFGAMAYYGANLFRDFLFEDLDEEAREGISQLWKESPFDPNRKLKRDAYRGTQAHKLHEQLCLGEAEVVGPVLSAQGKDTGSWWIKDSMGLTVIAEEYDAGVAKAYDEVFRHFDGELLSETRVYWTEHPVEDCPDEVCTHGFAGTLDTMIPAERIMLDVKTNKGDARWSAYPQMAFYGLAAEQMGLIDGPIEKQIVMIPRPDGTYDLFDDKFQGTEIVEPIRQLYKARRAWGPR